MTETTYTAAVLTKASRKRLLELVPAAYASVRADHVTLTREPTAEQREAFEEGATVRFQVTGSVTREGVQVVAVRGLPVTTGQPPHVTVSLAEGRQAQESGPTLATSRVRMLKSFTLEAVLKVFEH